MSFCSQGQLWESEGDRVMMGSVVNEYNVFCLLKIPLLSFRMLRKSFERLPSWNFTKRYYRKKKKVIWSQRDVWFQTFITLSSYSETDWWFQIFLMFIPYLGKWSNLTNIFQMGWNHQLGEISGLLLLFSILLPLNREKPVLLLFFKNGKTGEFIAAANGSRYMCNEALIKQARTTRVNDQL